MMQYPQKEGRNGPIFQIAEGLYVTLNEYGRWQVVLKRGNNRKKKAFGRSEEDRQRAVKAAELLAARLGLSLERPTDKSFGMIAEDWFNDGATRWKPGTQERYRSIIRDFLRPLHKLSLDQVDRVRLRRLLLDLLKIRSPNTVEVVHAVISSIFNEAIELGYTDKNPAYALLKRILPAKKKRNLSEPDPLTRQDLERFLHAAWAKLPEPHSLILEVLAMTGLRLGEALAMRAENLDAHNCQYTVTESTRSGRFGPPKNGNRLIDLDATLVAKLEAHLRKMAKGRPFSGRYIFPQVTQRMVQRAMQSACRYARLRVRHPHDLRHTYATLLLMAHISPAYVQKQLGHHSINMTVDIYGHWIPGEGRENLDKTLRGPKAQPGKLLTVVTGD